MCTCTYMYHCVRALLSHLPYCAQHTHTLTRGLGLLFLISNYSFVMLRTAQQSYIAKTKKKKQINARKHLRFIWVQPQMCVWARGKTALCFHVFYICAVKWKKKYCVESNYVLYSCICMCFWRMMCMCLLLLIYHNQKNIKKTECDRVTKCAVDARAMAHVQFKYKLK